MYFSNQFQFFRNNSQKLHIRAQTLFYIVSNILQTEYSQWTKRKYIVSEITKVGLALTIQSCDIFCVYQFMAFSFATLTFQQFNRFVIMLKHFIKTRFLSLLNKIPFISQQNEKIKWYWPMMQYNIVQIVYYGWLLAKYCGN